MRNLTEELLLRARDDHRSVVRRCFFALVATAIVHLLVILPLAGAGRERAISRAEAERLAVASAELAEMGPPIAACETVARSTLEPALGDLVEALRGDLQRLEATRDYLDVVLNPDAAPAFPQDGEADEDEDAVRPFDIADADAIVALSRARGREETLTALEPLVSGLILRPRYGDLRERWRREALAGIEARLDGAASAIPALRAQFPAAEAAWDGLAAELATLRRTAREIEIEPLEDPHWWALDQEAGGRGDVVLQLSPEVEERLQTPSMLDPMTATVSRVLRRHSELVETVEARRQALTAQVEAGGGDGSAAILRWTGLSTQDFAISFPLVLGVILSLALLLPLRPWREMGLLAGYLPPDSALREWLAGDERLLGTPLRTALSLLWVVGAAIVHLLGKPAEEFVLETMIWTIPGLLSVAAAGGYRRSVEQKVIDALPREQAEALEVGWTEEEPVEEEDSSMVSFEEEETDVLEDVFADVFENIDSDPDPDDSLDVQTLKR